MVCCCDFSGKVPAVGCVDDVLDCPETTPERAVKFRRVNPPRNRMDGDIEKVVSEEKIRQLSRSIMDVLWFSLWNKAE